jgi:hypothetical protein
VSVLALSTPLAHWCEDAQNNNEVDTYCDVSGKHTNEDQKPRENNDAQQHNKTVWSSMEYHHTPHRSESFVDVARLPHFHRGESAHAHHTQYSSGVSILEVEGEVNPVDLLS